MFPEKLKLLRKKKGITQETLATEIGVERSSIGKYESTNSGVSPSLDVVVKIADYFDVSIDYLLGRVDAPDLIKKELPAVGGEPASMVLRKDVADDEELIRVAQEAAQRAIEAYKKGHSQD